MESSPELRGIQPCLYACTELHSNRASEERAVYLTFSSVTLRGKRRVRLAVSEDPGGFGSVLTCH